MSVKPRIVPFAFEEGPAKTGQAVNLQCFVPEGDLPLLIEWTMNFKNILENQNVNIANIGRRSSVLTIDPIEAKHAGNYTCSAINHAGSVNFTTELFVNGY